MSQLCKRKVRRPGACGAGRVAGRDVCVSRYRLHGLGGPLQEQHTLCLSHLIQVTLLAAAESTQGPARSPAWRAEEESSPLPLGCPWSSCDNEIFKHSGLLARQREDVREVG